MNNYPSFESNQGVRNEKSVLYNFNLKIMDNISLEGSSETESNLNRNVKAFNDMESNQSKESKFINFDDDEINFFDDDTDEPITNLNMNPNANQFLRMKTHYSKIAIHYKNLCKSYKKQLVDAHKTIRDLHSTIEQMECKNWLQKKEKNEFQLMKLESEESMRNTIEKCRIYCEKLNQLSCTTNEDRLLTNEPYDMNNQEKMILTTMRHLIKEKAEIKNFSKSFNSLINFINPNSLQLNSIKQLNKINYMSLNNVLKETLEFLNNNSLRNFNCRCNGVFDFDKQLYNEKNNNYLTVMQSQNSKSKISQNDCLKVSPYKSSSSSSSSVYFSSSSSSSSSSSPRFYSNSNNQVCDNYYKHQPSQEFLLKCLNLIQDLFDVDCFLNVPTKLNDLYYKLGQLNNFKNAIQNIFDSEANYTIEKLVCAVQSIHDQLNGKISTDLKGLLKSNNLQGVVDKFTMYDEYFPLFKELLDQIMKSLEVSRLDQIIPSIRALKILATPTLT